MGMARSPVGRDGKAITATSDSMNTSRLSPVATTMARSMPRRMAGMSFMAYSRINFSGVATDPSRKLSDIVNKRMGGRAPHVNSAGFTACT